MNPPFKIQCWNVYNAYPTTVRMLVPPDIEHFLYEPCEDDPGPLPTSVAVETWEWCAIGAYDAAGDNLCTASISG